MPLLEEPVHGRRTTLLEKLVVLMLLLNLAVIIAVTVTAVVIIKRVDDKVDQVDRRINDTVGELKASFPTTDQLRDQFR